MAPEIPVKPLPFTEAVPVTNATSDDGCSTITLEEIDYLNGESVADQTAKLLRYEICTLPSRKWNNQITKDTLMQFLR